jgi:hypothetical protein
VVQDAALPYVSNDEFRVTGRQPTQRVADLNNPILQPWARDKVRERNELVLSGKQVFSAHASCWPAGVPHFLLEPMTRPMYIVQGPKEVVMILTSFNDVRRIYLADKHPADVKTSWYGDSIGHYEGDALVVDTVGVAVAHLSSLDRYGTPHTEALHVVEHYHMIDQAPVAAEPRGTGGFRGDDDAVDRTYKGKVLRVDFTVEDAGTFNMPWSGVVVYNRAKGRFIEDVCAENIHDYIMGRDSAVPTAKSTLISGE